MKKLPENKKEITRKFLLALPNRAWDKETVYDSLFIVPTYELHDSGYKLQAIIGVTHLDKFQEAEIAAICDDICWSMPKVHPYGRREGSVNKMILRTDCYPSGVFRMWGSSEHYFTGKFKVGFSLSSTDVGLVVYPHGDGINKMTGEVIKESA